jgi:hypothetical protein
MLALSRQLRSYALTGSYNYGRQLERKALDALDRWLAARRSLDLLRRAVTMLLEHEDKIPSVSLSVKAEDIRMRHTLDAGTLFQDHSRLDDDSTLMANILTNLWLAPWERARYTRLLNGLTEAGLRSAELEPRAAAELLESWETNAGTRLEFWSLDRGLSLLHPNSPRSDLERWSQLYSDSELGAMFRTETLKDRLQDGLDRTRLRAAQVKAALLLYQERHNGESAQDLDALVKSQTISAIPLDPFDGQPLRYRRTAGNDVNWGKTGDNVPLPAAISGVLWSVGPDGIDHGGLNSGPLFWDDKDKVSQWAAQRLDAIIPVPQWKPK